MNKQLYENDETEIELPTIKDESLSNFPKLTNAPAQPIETSNNRKPLIKRETTDKQFTETIEGPTPLIHEETIKLPFLKEDNNHIEEYSLTDTANVELPIFKVDEIEELVKIIAKNFPKESQEKLLPEKTEILPLSNDEKVLIKNEDTTQQTSTQEILVEEILVTTENNTQEEKCKIKKEKKGKLKKIFLKFAIFLSIIGLIYSGVNLVKWHLENKTLEKELNQIQDLIEETVLMPSSISEDTPLGVLEESNQDSNKVDYSHIPLINVDFSKLKTINPDTQAFLKVNNLDISVPVVQTTDNSYYLTHSFEKKYSSAGWVFGDYRNNWNNLNKNTIIYGHNRKNNVLFGSLKLMYNKSWYENKDNHIIYLSTSDKNILFEIFSVYDIETETYYLASDFATDQVYQEYLDTVTSRSKIKFDIKPTIEDKILTLSTCRYTNSKTVVHAKLIKIEDKIN